MTTPRVETPQEMFDWFGQLRENSDLTEAEWLDVVADYVIKLGDEFHNKVRELLLEAFGDLLADR